MNLHNYFDLFILVIIIVKFLFIFMVLFESYLKYYKPEEEYLIDVLRSMKKRIKFLFILLMSFLLAYLFNPFSNNHLLINRESKFLLFVFGLTLLFLIDWSILFKEPRFLKILQYSIGNEEVKNVEANNYEH